VVGGHQRGPDRLAGGPARGAPWLGCDDGPGGIRGHGSRSSAARGSIARWTGEHGDAATALQLSQELLPDRIRILRPDHPDVLISRGYLAAWTGWRGDAAGALQRFQELLPDQIRILGPDHPEVLATRANIAFWIAPPIGNAEPEKE
jgi:hypothetical protein